LYLKYKDKIIEIIIFYRVNDNTKTRVIIVHARYSKMLGEYYLTSYYRKKVLEDLIIYMNKVRTELGVDDIILIRELN